MHTWSVIVVCCAPTLHTGWFKSRWWFTWCARTVHCASASNAVLCPKSAATRKFCAQHCIAGPKNCVCCIFLCAKIADCRNPGVQQCATAATGRVNCDKQNDGRLLPWLLSSVWIVNYRFFLFLKITHTNLSAAFQSLMHIWRAHFEISKVWNFQLIWDGCH